MSKEHRHIVTPHVAAENRDKIHDNDDNKNRRLLV